MQGWVGRQIVRHATSHGGMETTMQGRAAHPGQEPIPAGLIRLSVGCEDVDDLWGDLEAALIVNEAGSTLGI
jgi:cystathionine gamma-synthase